MEAQGTIRDGVKKDSSRKNWDEIPDLGYTPFKGTLNVSLEKKPDIPEEGKIVLFDFFDCWKGFINGNPCHVCFRKNKGNKRMAFIIAPTKLRETHNINTGDKVTVKI